jgi:hypothetical protein
MAPTVYGVGDLSWVKGRLHSTVPIVIELWPGKHVMKVISIDPGGTTGYCPAVVDDNELTISIREGRLSELALYDLLDHWRPEIVIAEDFEYRNPGRAGLDLTPVKLLGVISVWCQQNKVAPIFQKASLGKAYFSNDKLHALKLYRRGKPHGRDALRHLLQWWQFGAGFQYCGKKGKVVINDGS